MSLFLLPPLRASAGEGMSFDGAAFAIAAATFLGEEGRTFLREWRLPSLSTKISPPRSWLKARRLVEAVAIFDVAVDVNIEDEEYRFPSLSTCNSFEEDSESSLILRRC